MTTIVPRIVCRPDGWYVYLAGAKLGPYLTDDAAYEAADDLMGAGEPDALDLEEQIRIRGNDAWRRRL